MKKLTFKELAQKILKEEKRPLTVEEIWDIAVKKGYDQLCSTNGKTPWRTIGAQIYVDIRDNPDSPFVKIDSKPKKFFLKTLVSEVELKEIEEKERGKIEAPKKLGYTERDLHPFLTYFAYAYMNANKYIKNRLEFNVILLPYLFGSTAVEGAKSARWILKTTKKIIDLTAMNKPCGIDLYSHTQTTCLEKFNCKIFHEYISLRKEWITIKQITKGGML